MVVNRDEIGMICSSALQEQRLQGRPQCAVQSPYSSQDCEDREGDSMSGGSLGQDGSSQAGRTAWRPPE